MEEKHIKELLKKYHEGRCSEAEKALLESWYLQYNEEDIKINHRRVTATGRQLFRQLPGNETAFAHIATWLVAATVLIGIITAVLINRTAPDNPPALTAIKDIAPGTNKAVLTLADGQKINLGSALNGRLAVQGNTKIIKTAGGRIVYDGAGNVTRSNNITTPNGGQWQVQLPDGTRVWINAASSLTYPASFSNASQRIVELSGEAYFEVAKDKLHPFVVKTARQQVRVLGTHFNIQSYQDEAAEKTTLLEGQVKITAKETTILLLPGQQSVLTNDHLSESPANIEQAVAWKNGYFRFNDEKIQEIMRQLSRWYNITVRYEGPVPGSGLNGKISRYKNISQVLAALEATKTVHFKVEGRRVTVMP